jgi:hypothetical protein
MPKSYPIRDGVPIPARAASIYPFDQLEVGQMFALPAKDVVAVRAAALRYAHKHPGTAFAVRRLKGIAAGYGCWRKK